MPRQLKKQEIYQISFHDECIDRAYVGTGVFDGQDDDCSKEFGEFHGFFILPDGERASFPISSVGIHLEKDKKMPLEKYSNKEIEEEIAKRKEMEQIAKKGRRDKKLQIILQNIDVFLSLVDHGRTSCSDEKPDNIHRCSRCDLLRFKKDGCWDQTLEFSIFTDA
jgi:hypothetical protein